MMPRFKTRSSGARTFRVRRSSTRNLRARCLTRRSFRAQTSTTRNFRARRSTARSFRARCSYPRSSRLLTAYNTLWTTIGSLPPGSLRDRALERIHGLDCSNPDKTLASCAPFSAPPPEVTWAAPLEKSSVDEEAYAIALAKTLKELVCSGGDNDIYLAGGFGLGLFSGSP